MGPPGGPQGSLGPARRDRWAQVASGGTLSPSGRNRSPKRGAGDAQRCGDGFSHAPFPCPHPGPCSAQGSYPPSPASPALPSSSQRGFGAGVAPQTYPPLPFRAKARLNEARGLRFVPTKHLKALWKVAGPKGAAAPGHLAVLSTRVGPCLPRASAATRGSAGEGLQCPGITMLRAAASQQPGCWKKSVKAD